MGTNMTKLKEIGIFNEIDFHFAELMCELAGDKGSDTLRLSAMLVSNITLGNRHICIDLAEHAAKKLNEYPESIGKEFKAELESISFPATAAKWREELLITNVVGLEANQNQTKTPLVIDEHNRLYIYRYWEYEHKLAEIIRKKAKVKKTTAPEAWGRMMAEYSRDRQNKNFEWKIDEWQKLAVFLALRNHFSVISGGPGTGKTTIAAAVLSLIIEQAHDVENGKIRIAVCAPTGKAAVRIQESLEKNLSTKAKEIIVGNGFSELIKAKTIHRLLGFIPGSPYFTHNAENPLSADVVVVDEASMVPLPLMTKLFKALGADTQLILLGDHHQLASVESGAILADICAATNSEHFTKEFMQEFKQFSAKSGGSDESNKPEESDNAATQCMVDTAVALKNNYRSNKKIAEISCLINAGNATDAWKELTNGQNKSITILKPAGNAELKKALKKIIDETAYSSFHREQNVGAACNSFNKFRILCSNREGPYGVNNINRLITEILADKADGNNPNCSTNYKGRPVIITENDYTMNLFNGDTGIIWHDEPVDSNGDKPELRAYFPQTGTNSFISFPVSRLPAHDTAYAMTIHKSQGSGFERILMILPDIYNPVLTRELIYTGLTRAEEAVQLMVNQEVFEKAVAACIKRDSGLQDRLKEI